MLTIPSVGCEGNGAPEELVSNTGMGASAMAAALRNGNIDALLALADLLEANGTKEKTRDFVFQVICELLPDDGKDRMLARPPCRYGNVVDLASRKPLV